MPSITRILLIEGDPDTARLVKDLLENSKRGTFVVSVVDTPKDAFDRLADNDMDLVIAGSTDDPINGLDFIQDFHAKRFHIPVIALTPHGDRSAQVNAIADGASEYLERGTLNVEILERTCFYAISLAEKRKANGSNSPGVGVLIEQLVDLTRESVRAQTDQTNELRELRKEIDTGFGGLRGEITRHQDENAKQHKEIMEEIHSTWTVRWVLDWIILHPAAAVAIFAGLALAATLVVLLLQVVDIKKLKGIKEAVSMAEVGSVWIAGKLP